MGRQNTKIHSQSLSCPNILPRYFGSQNHGGQWTAVAVGRWIGIRWGSWEFLKVLNFNFGAVVDKS
ncbi:hypothetical protein [Moraxella lacunata]|uniref:hypothetical protein n=1 Tax=Moraxella lacunata TaxID=477 RepID=UPI003EE3A684